MAVRNRWRHIFGTYRGPVLKRRCSGRLRGRLKQLFQRVSRNRGFGPHLKLSQRGARLARSVGLAPESVSITVQVVWIGTSHRDVGRRVPRAVTRPSRAVVVVDRRVEALVGIAVGAPVPVLVEIPAIHGATSERSTMVQVVAPPVFPHRHFDVSIDDPVDPPAPTREINDVVGASSQGRIESGCYEVSSSGITGLVAAAEADAPNAREISTGASLALWFADFGAKAIGKATTAGAIMEIPLGASSFPWQIAGGPDGNLWFTDQGSGGAIVQMTPGGSVTEFRAGLSGLPDDIAAGPDGNLWFTESGVIGRITPTGSITEFSAAGGNPIGIAPGPDGNMWFGDAIGRIGRIGTAVQSQTQTFPRRPSNKFGIRRLRLNTKNGTAILPVRVPGPGILSLFGRGVVSQRPALLKRTPSRLERRVRGPGIFGLLVKPKRKARQKLNRTGQVRVMVRIRFKPLGGRPSGKSKRITLRKDLRRHGAPKPSLPPRRIGDGGGRS
jgi:hypothetical protein